MEGLETSQAASNQTALTTGASDASNPSGSANVATGSEAGLGADEQQRQQPTDHAIPRMEKRIGKVVGELHQTRGELQRALQEIAQMRASAPQPKQPVRADLPAGPEGDALWARFEGQRGAQEVFAQRDTAFAKQQQEAQQEHLAQQEQRQRIGSFQERAKAIPGLLEKMSQSALELPDAVHDVILDNPMGPHIANYLLDNPAELARLETLTPKAQEYQLAVLQVQLDQVAKGKQAPSPTAGAASRGQGAQRVSMQTMTMQQTQEYFQKHGKFPFST